MLYPIGIQDFWSIRREGCVYVDKTDLIFDIAWRTGDWGRYVATATLLHHI